ncbi:hypothetical protein TNCV_4411511 [Trichonephila clavipes]|nr:hypothetical protein TNCV_4411511 [Trichonephila clavipes]
MGISPGTTTQRLQWKNFSEFLNLVNCSTVFCRNRLTVPPPFHTISHDGFPTVDSDKLVDKVVILYVESLEF